MSTDFDSHLRETFDDRTGMVDVPPVDTIALVARGRRAKNLRRFGAVTGTAAVGVAAVMAVTVLFHGGGQSSGQSDQRLDAGPAVATFGATGPEPVVGPRAVFVTKHQVFVNGRAHEVQLPFATGAHIGQLGVAYPAGAANRPTLLNMDGTSTALAPESPKLAGASYYAWVAADSASGLVAWAEVTKTEAEIVAFDTRTMKELGRRRLPCNVSGSVSGCPVPYVASNGVVFIFVEQGALVWQPATDTLSQVESVQPSQAHNKILTNFEGMHDGVPSVLEGWEEAKSSNGVEGILSYDGQWILDANGDPTVVNWRDPRETIKYNPPGTVAAATFDTDGSVLVVTSDNGKWTGWDCSLGGSCQEVVSPRVEEIRLVAWDL